jgi:hypothetical protein
MLLPWKGRATIVLTVLYRTRAAGLWGSIKHALNAPNSGLRMVSRLFPEGVQTIMEPSTMVVA